MQPFVFNVLCINMFIMLNANHDELFGKFINLIFTDVGNTNSISCLVNIYSSLFTTMHFHVYHDIPRQSAVVYYANTISAD